MKKNLTAILLASSIVGGCATEGPRVQTPGSFVRDVYEITAKGGYVQDHNQNKELLKTQVKGNKYQNIIDMFEAENKCFTDKYSNIPTAPEGSDKINFYASVLSSMTKPQINTMVSAYNECLIKGIRDMRREEYIYKRITSGAIAAFIAASLFGMGGHSITNTPPSNYTIDMGGASRAIGNVTK